MIARGARALPPILGALLFLLALALAFAAADALGADRPEMARGEKDYGVSCLALVGFSEARSESEKGEAAVQLVVLNRTRDRRWPATICEAALQASQFHGLDKWPPPREPWTIDAAAWERSLSIARELLDRNLSKVPPACRGALYFAQAPSSALVLCREGAHFFSVD